MSLGDTKVVVAMSGGVDSSVAAALLVEAGYDVVGMMMRLWSDPALGGEQYNRCCTPEQMADARRVARQLGIPFYALDTKAVFRDSVVRYFIERASRWRHAQPLPGMQPQDPLRLAAEERAGAGRGLPRHRALRAHRSRRGGTFSFARRRRPRQRPKLCAFGHGAGAAASYAFSGRRLSKSQVRELARRFGLAVGGKKDSQDLCFLGGHDYRDFLRAHAPDLNTSGPILRRDGTLLGQHRGLSNYTIGQRKGLGLSYHLPLYVLDKQPLRNALIVGEKPELGGTQLLATGVNWISGIAPTQAFPAAVKIRYQARPQSATVHPISPASMRIIFDEPQRDITPGQAAVVYAGDVCLGGGVISSADCASEHAEESQLVIQH